MQSRRGKVPDTASEEQCDVFICTNEVLSLHHQCPRLQFPGSILRRHFFFVSKCLVSKKQIGTLTNCRHHGKLQLGSVPISSRCPASPTKGEWGVQLVKPWPMGPDFKTFQTPPQGSGCALCSCAVCGIFRGARLWGRIYQLQPPSG